MAKDDDPNPTAVNRLNQVQNHLPKSPKKRLRKQSSTPQLPADYSDILNHIATLKKIAATPDPANRGYVRQKQAGKLWVRERVEAFVDPGTFREVGSVSGTVSWRDLGGGKEEPAECEY